MQTESLFAPVTKKGADKLFPHIWPAAIIGFGFVLTAAWGALLGYGIIMLIRIAF
jgi:hypothetical protein